MEAPVGKPRELCPEGSHQACLISIIDMGTQKSNNPKFQDSRRVYYNFEITDPKIKKEDGTPFFLRRDYTFSQKSKNLLKDLKGWLGVKNLVGYDLDTALGKHAIIKVTHTEDEQYDNIENISEVPRGVKLFKASTPLISFYLNEFDEDTFKSLPQWQQDKIVASPEYKEAREAVETEKKGKKDAKAGKAKAGKGK